jgi:glyceraldehyde 3-phosphate dehydrogenase
MKQMDITAKDHPYLSTEAQTLPIKLGINGLGRIGKLTLWHHVSRRSFQALVVNIGRKVGTGLNDVAEYIERDSTYGPLARYIHGFRGRRVIEDLDERKGTMIINGVPVTVLRENRNPRDISWAENDVKLVVDCTGVFRDPTVSPDEPAGALRGHLEAGAEKVILSAPFKIGDKSKAMPEDAVTIIKGINGETYDHKKHKIISGASCTTTCLAFTIKVLMDHFGPERILGASMVTVHATTGTQEILDQLPSPGTDDLRKNRSIFNNIILTSTGAAKATALVIPEMKNIGFVAESVRIPTNTGSIVILTLSIQDDDPEKPIEPDKINRLYREAAEGRLSRYLSYTDTQNVSSDVIGTVSAAIIEGRETRAHTGNMHVNLSRACRFIAESEPSSEMEGSTLVAPVTQVVVYSWYDNELGSFSNMLGETTMEIAGVSLSPSA